MAWWNGEGTLVRMSCPACGHFALFADQYNGAPKIECRECELRGVKAVQSAFNKWLTPSAKEPSP